MTITITKLASTIRDMATHSNAKAEKVVRTILSEVVCAVLEDERVELRGLGTFTLGARSATVGRNVQTGEPVAIPARRTVKFKPSKTLKDALKAAPVPMREAPDDRDR